MILNMDLFCRIQLWSAFNENHVNEKTARGDFMRHIRHFERVALRDEERNLSVVFLISVIPALVPRSPEGEVGNVEMTEKLFPTV